MDAPNGSKENENFDMLALLAHNRLTSQNYDQALNLYRFLNLSQPNDWRWICGIIYCLIGLGDLEQAAKLLKLKGGQIQQESSSIEKTLNNRIQHMIHT